MMQHAAMYAVFRALTRPVTALRYGTAWGLLACLQAAFQSASCCPCSLCCGSPSHMPSGCSELQNSVGLLALLWQSGSPWPLSVALCSAALRSRITASQGAAVHVLLLHCVLNNPACHAACLLAGPSGSCRAVYPISIGRCVVPCKPLRSKRSWCAFCRPGILQQAALCTSP
jgi:hypothetical protein